MIQIFNITTINFFFYNNNILFCNYYFLLLRYIEFNSRHDDNIIKEIDIRLPSSVETL